MLKTRRRMKLSPEEELFLRQLDRYGEAHYQDVPVPAKRLQIERGVRPAELAHLIAAAIPDRLCHKKGVWTVWNPTSLCKKRGVRASPRFQTPCLCTALPKTPSGRRCDTTLSRVGAMDSATGLLSMPVIAMASNARTSSETTARGAAGRFPLPARFLFCVCRGAVQSIIYTYVSYSSDRELARLEQAWRW